MKITKQDFNKLNQLDRIEFRQKISMLDNDKPSLSSIGFINNIILGLAYVILVSLMVRDDIYVFTNVVNIIPLIIKIAIPVTILLVFLDIASIVFHYKKKKSIMKEYFKEKIEVKK